jgi:hypothetical protein
MSAPLAPGVRRALRRIPLILEESGYTTETALMAELGAEYRDVRAAIGILYGQGRVDRVIGYVVLPGRRSLVTRRAA